MKMRGDPPAGPFTFSDTRMDADMVDQEFKNISDKVAKARHVVANAEIAAAEVFFFLSQWL